MPRPGHYDLGAISKAEFVGLLRREPVESYIGYAETAEFVQSISDIEIPVSRAQADLRDGDEMLIIRLRYRVADPGQKGRLAPRPEDYEFFYCRYQAA